MGRPKISDLVEFIRHHSLWSLRTFGPGSRLTGLVSHIRKELHEIEDNPSDSTEWLDVIILAIDGAVRNGFDPVTLADALRWKQLENEARVWPNWQKLTEQEKNEPIEHVKEIANA